MWHLLQGAFFLGVCLAVAAWILWKRVGQRWWYLQQERNAQAIEDMSNEDLHRLLGGKHLPAWINFPDYQRVQWVNEVVGMFRCFGNVVTSQTMGLLCFALLGS